MKNDRINTVAEVAWEACETAESMKAKSAAESAKAESARAAAWVAKVWAALWAAKAVAEEPPAGKPGNQ